MRRQLSNPWQKLIPAAVLLASYPLLTSLIPIQNAFALTIEKVDFNGDGYSDLVIGVPDEDINGQADAGSVNIIYGSVSGLSATSIPDQRFFQDYSIPGDVSSNLRDFSEVDDFFGYAVGAGDFNGDGYTDLAVGVPGEDIDTVTDAGAVNLIYGSSSGLSVNNPIINQMWSQDSLGLEDTSEMGDMFGSSLTAGDFNGDGYTDLAVGVPGESISGHAKAGSVNIIYGSASGLSATSIPDQRFFQDTADVADFSEPDDMYGTSLTTGDLNGDGYTDLAVGVPGEDIGMVADAGAISVIYGSSSGLTPSNPVADQLWTGSTEGISDNLPNTCPTPISGIGNERAIAVGDFDNDGYDDMAFGAATHLAGEGGAGEEPCGDSYYGVNGFLIVVYGSSSGLAITDLKPDQFGRENTIADNYGTLSHGDFNGDGYEDLASSFAVFGIVSAGDISGGGFGAVRIYYGSPEGLPEGPGGRLMPSSYIEQAGDVENGNETQDNFGYAIAAGDFNGDGYHDMAAGAPGEESGPRSTDFAPNDDNMGAVDVLYGSSSSLSGTQFWTQDSPDVEDWSEIGDRFGSVLVSG